MSDISTLAHEYKLYRKSVALLSDVRFNILKRREFILYKTSTSQDNVNLSYVINREISSDNNVHLTDTSFVLPENTILDNQNVYKFTAKTTVSKTDKFLVTDVYAHGTIPLFYQHSFGGYNDSTETLISAFIVDDAFQPVTDKETLLDLDAGVIYNNFENTFSPNTGESTIYYVQYTTKNNTTLITSSYTEILNNLPVFRLATADDLDGTGMLDVNKKVYTIEIFNSNYFEVTFPLIDTYTLKQGNDAKIFISPPPRSSTTDPWFITVNNTQLFASIRTSATEVTTVKYNIPEFVYQTFTPVYPYKSIVDNGAEFVNEHLIKVARTNLYDDPDNDIFTSIKVYDSAGDLKQSFTTDDSLIDTLDTEDNDITITDGIRSIDKLGGFIDLQDTVSSTDTIVATYYYEATNLEYIDIDFNPISNPDILQYKVVFYIVPNTNDSRTRTVYHLLVDKTGLVISTSQTDNADLTSDIATETLYYNIGTGTFPSLYSFIDNYTIQASDVNEFVNADNPHYFILAEVFTRENSSPNQSTIFDIRKPGGGLKESVIDSLVEPFPEVLWTVGNSQWEGQPWPGTSSFLVEIPNKLQVFTEGDFNDVSIRKAVEKHSAFGCYPIIRGYNHSNPDITVETADDSLTITWPSMGNDYGFNVYYSLFEDHDYTLANTTVLSNHAAGNTYTITGLSAGVTYYVYVVSVNTITNIELPDTIIRPAKVTT